MLTVYEAFILYHFLNLLFSLMDRLMDISTKNVPFVTIANRHNTKMHRYKNSNGASVVVL